MVEAQAPSALESAFAQPSSGGSITWRRFRRERAAFCALVVLVSLVLACFVGEPIFAHLLGHSANTFFPGAVNVNLKPVGPWSWIPNQPMNAPQAHGKAFFLLGADGTLGRDEFLRILTGGTLSLEISFIATALALIVGVSLGTLAGYFGGVLDTVVGRLTELTMAFPILLLVVAIGQTIAQRFEAFTLRGIFEPGVLALGVTIGIFSWFYPARVVRALVQSLREYEFVEAARMTGSSELRVIRKHVLPHLAGPVIVWGTLVAASVIVLEAALSVLNFGIALGTASWGNLLSSSWGTLLNYDPARNAEQAEKSNWPLVWPSVALFVTVLCLALIGDGLRTALDPKGEG